MKSQALKQVVIILLLIIFPLAGYVYGEIIPQDRRINWSPGIPGGIPSRTTICANVKNSPYNAVGNGIADDTTAITNAISACPSGQVVYIPEGTYKITGQISIKKGIVLRGDGPDKTKIKDYSSTAKGAIIQFGAASTPSAISASSGYTKGSTSITVSNASGLSVGDYIVIDQLNDSTQSITNNGCGGSCTWCSRENGSRSLGQILKITNKSSNTLTVDPALYYTYSSSNTPEVFKLSNVVEYAGVEDLYVGNTNGNSMRNFQIDNCAYCWIKNIESYNGKTNNVGIFYSYRSEIRDSYFHHVTDHVTNRYGIFLGYNTTATLVENNIFYYQAYPIMIGWGAAGNVFGYNYTYYNFLANTPTWFHPDVVFHGAHTHMNLFEGNVVQGVQGDFYWGSHSYNTFYRNHISMLTTPDTVYQSVVAAAFQSNNYYMNLAGNIFGRPGLTGVYEEENITCSHSTKAIFKLGYAPVGGNCDGDCDAAGNDGNVLLTLYRHGNYDYVTQSTKWDTNNADQNIPNSLYLTSKPAFFGNLPWPAIGPDLNPIVGTIPAKELFDCKMAGGCGGSGGGDTGGNTGSGGDSSASGGSGCGFVKDSNNGAQNLTLLAAALIIILLLRKITNKISFNKYLKIFLFCLSFISLSATPLLAATINAASCSASDVQAAINAASDGDTVSVPAGSCTWSTAVKLSKKGIIVQGAGIDATIITDATSSSWGDEPFWIEGAEGKSFRITGFTFKGISSDHGVIYIYGTSKNFRIDNCKFDNVGGRPIEIVGATYGVIDHCTFTGNLANIRVKGTYPGDESWQSALKLGSGEAVYVEDCIFDRSNDSVGAIDGQSGGRYVFRHNTVYNTYAANHGTETGYPERGIFSYEIYENNFTSPSNWFAAIYLRGGTGVIFNNTATGYQSMIQVRNFRSCEVRPQYTAWGMCDGTNPLDGNQEPNGYPCWDQIGRSTNQTLEPLYEWGNTLNGADADIIVGDCQAVLTHIKEGRDFYNDTQRPGYTPYTYPHPLTISGDTGGGNTPPPSSGGSDTSASGGSGCGFVKDIKGKGPKAKGEGVVFAMMLLISLTGIALLKKLSMK